MKQIYLKCLVLLVGMVMGIGNLWADEVTLSNADIVAAGDAASGYANLSITDDNNNVWNVYAIKNYHSNATSTYHFLQIKKYASSTAYYIQVPTLGTKINTITLTVSGASKAMDGGSNTATVYFSSDNTTSAAGTGVVSGTGDSSITLDASSLNLNTGYITASGAVRIWEITVDYSTDGVSTTAIQPSLTSSCSFLNSQDVTITNNESGATVYYTTDGTAPTTSSSSFTGTSTTISVSATTTVKAMAVISGKENSSVASATYTKLTPYTSIADALAAATSTATQAAFTFSGEVVTAASTKNAYIQDAEGNVAAIYNSTAQGFTQGQTISGTVICSIQLYNGILEFTNLTSSTSGITTGTGTPTATTKALADVSSSDYGKLVTIEGLTYDLTNTVFKNGDNTITPYKTFMTLPDFTNGSVYTITGIVLTYSSTLEIAPRSSDDIVVTQAADKQTPTITATYSTSLTAGGDANVFAVEYNGDGTLAVTSSNTSVATAAVSDKTVTVTPLAAGTSTITISAPETENYYAASLGYNVIVKAADESTFTWNLAKDETYSASETELRWMNAACSMVVAKADAETATNNYYPGTEGKTYSSTRLYKGSTLTFTPATGVTLGTITFTAISSTYATALASSTWTNATATASTDASPYTVTITPTDGTQAVSAVIGATVGGTGVVVTYTGTPVVEPYTIALSGTYPTSFDKGAEFSHEGMTVTATYTDGTTKDVTSSVTFSGFDMSTLGTQTVTVSYTESDKTVTVTYDIAVNNVLTPMDYETVDFTTVYSSVAENESETVGTYYGTSFTMEFAKPTSSTTSTKYYASGSAVRAYTGNTITITGASEIKNVIVNYVSGYTDDAATTAIEGTTATITFSKTCRFTSIKVVYVTIPGDVDVDGDVDMDDLTLLSSYLIGTNTATITEQGLKNAELSGDSTINIADLAKLIQLLNQ